jgi:hypothetical protein
MYNNMMFTVATYLLEKQSGLSFSDFLQERFFRPLGMHSTNLQPERARANGLSDRIATGYAWQEKIEEYKGFQSPDCPEADGAGSIITSVNDYIKWVKAMMNNEDPITAEVYNGLVKLRSIEDPEMDELPPFTSMTAYAVGWEVLFYRGHKVIQHSGSVPGFGTRHFFLPGFKFGGVIFGNSSDAGVAAQVLVQELIDEVLGVPKAERLDWNKIESAKESEDEDEEGKLREKICPGLKEPQPQTLPLSVYTGEYWNLGYHSIVVQVKDDKLFIDATDRSMGFTLTFDHVCEQTAYIAHLSDFLEGGDTTIRAEFEINKGRAVKLGLQFELDMEGLIWFDTTQ